MNARTPFITLLSALLLGTVPALAQSSDRPVTPNGENASKGSTSGPVQTITSGMPSTRAAPVHRTVHHVTQRRRAVVHNPVTPASAVTPMPTTPTSSAPSR